MIKNKNSILHYLMFVSICSIVISCTNTKNENNCISFQTASIISAQGADTGSINQIATFNISYGINNGCGHFESIEQSTNGDTTLVKVKTKYQGCVCTQMAGILTTPFTFSATIPGIYYFKFYQTDQSYLLDSIRIQ